MTWFEKLCALPIQWKLHKREYSYAIEFVTTKWWQLSCGRTVELAAEEAVRYYEAMERNTEEALKENGVMAL